MAEVMTQVVNALVLASVYVLIASGVTLVYGLTNTVMFAQGELLMLGAFLTYGFDSVGVPLPIAVLLAIVCTMILGLVMERALFSRTIDRPINGFILSLGLIIVLQNAVAKATSGRENVTIEPPVAGVWDVGGVLIAQQRAVVFGVAMLSMAGLIFVLRRTRVGWALRATADDRFAAELMGIPSRRLMTGTFVFGAGFAAFGGALMLSLFPITPYVGSSVIIKAFAIAIIGGLGSVEGAVIAALLIAAVEGLGAGYLEPQLASAYGFLLMIVMLLVRPQGLFRGARGGQLH